MTIEIALVLAILVLAIILFVTERLRMDVVALLILCLLAALQLVTPAQALSGFSNPAVVTVWAMFIISGGLSMTGVADILGRQVLRVAGEGEARLIIVIMTTAGVMSAFMNNVGVAAMMLPVVIDIARRTKRPPSRLLMPLALGSLLGGLTTLIGTPPNILVSDALRDYDLTPFGLFDYTPIGLVLMVTGILFVAFVGRHLLPHRDPMQESSTEARQVFDLSEQLLMVRLPAGSPLTGKTLAESRLGSALRLNVVAIVRNGQTQLAPGADIVLRGDDQLLVQGRPDTLLELQEQENLAIEEASPELAQRVAAELGLAEARLTEQSGPVGQTLYQFGLRRRYGVNVLAIRRNGVIRQTNLQDTLLQAGDRLLLLGPNAALESLTAASDFAVVQPLSEKEAAESYNLQQRYVVLRLTPQSSLAGYTLAESRIGDAFGLTVVGIARQGEEEIRLLPEPDTALQAEDRLVVKGPAQALSILQGLHSLEFVDQPTPALDSLESAQIGHAEIVLSPQTTLEGRTLRELHFRDKYGLNVLAIWRRGEAIRENLRDTALRFGDAVLVYGPRSKLRVLSGEPDFIVITEPVQQMLRPKKAPIAVLILAAILLPVIIGYFHISIAAVIGATLMVLTGCLTMKEAYRFIEWPAVFLIAGMLPLGLAMEQTGAARFLAEGVITAVGGMGPHAVLAGIFLLTSLATQIIPTAALVVLMAPIAFNTALDVGISPYPLMMAVAMAASASFSSPVSHPANVMVMGPGGYRFIDYIKVGLPLTLLIFVLVVILVPILWPF